MTTNAELIAAAAAELESWNSCFRGTGTVEPGRVVMARHILATVRDDDDEPMTEEWLPSIPDQGFRPIAKIAEPNKPLWCCRSGVVIDFINKRMSVSGWPVPWKETRGQLRSLLTALNIPLPATK